MKKSFAILVLMTLLGLSLIGCSGKKWEIKYYLDCIDREVVVESWNFDDPYEGNLYSYRLNGVEKSVRKIDCARTRTKVYDPIVEYEKMKEI